ncbi:MULTISPECIES: hypothetical protein [unclassified Streptomyces]
MVTLATCLGYARHRRPGLAQPLGIARTTFGIFACIAIAILHTLI